MSEDTKTPATNASSRRQEVDALLADLSLDMKASEIPKKTAAPRPRPSEKPPPGTRPNEAQSLLDDLEGMVQRRRHLQRDPRDNSATAKLSKPHPTSGALRPLKMEAQAIPAQMEGDTPKSKDQTTAPPSEQPDDVQNNPASEMEPTEKVQPAATESQTNDSKAWGAWGGGAPWGHLFSTATKFAGQARDEIGRRTAAIVQTGTGEKGLSTDQNIYDLGTKMAQRVRGLVQDAHLDQLGQNLSEVGRKGWNDILNAVVLPVEAHDSVSVTVSHGTYGSC